jgi:hypothetical protein
VAAKRQRSATLSRMVERSRLERTRDRYAPKFGIVAETWSVV